jgi:hypothetical protein
MYLLTYLLCMVCNCTKPYGWERSQGKEQCRVNHASMPYGSRYIF